VACVIVDECFAEDSQVLTPWGCKPIKDIKSGDKVINYSETTKEFKVDTVVKQHKNLTNSVCETMFELEFDNGKKIQVTGNHKFLTDQGWVRADALTEDHEIINKT
jgi:intein/homing endonuclease